MKLAHIAPTSLLSTELFLALDFHLCLASQALVDKQYADYFRNANGRVILDVPTWEEKNTEQGYSLDKLYRAIELVRPSEVALPDLWGSSAKQAIDLAYLASNAISTRFGLAKPSYLVIPRGHTWEECVNCAIEMSQIPGVTTLGILDGTYEKFNVTRLQAVLEFSKLFTRLDLHLLGVQRNLADIQNKEIRKRVRSADTAKLVRWALDCKFPMVGNVPVYKGRGEEYFSREVNDLQMSYVVRNVNYWNDLCGG